VTFVRMLQLLIGVSSEAGGLPAPPPPPLYPPTPPHPHQFMCLGRFSAVTFQVLGHTKTILVLLISWLVLHEPMSGRKMFGMGLAVAGMVGYGHFNSKVSTANAVKASESLPLLNKQRVTADNEVGVVLVCVRVCVCWWVWVGWGGPGGPGATFSPRVSDSGQTQVQPCLHHPTPPSPHTTTNHHLTTTRCTCPQTSRYRWT